MFTSLHLLLLILFLLLLPHSKSLILPLTTQKIPSISPPKPLTTARATNKLRFHHNVTLTVTLAVGTPPQNVSMVLDTGSELSWLLCNSSSAAAAPGGGGAHAANSSSFRSKSSSSYSPLPCSSPICTSRSRDLPTPATCDPSTKRCHVSVSYADASSSDGALALDNFQVGNYPPIRTAFGCMDSGSPASPDDPAAAGLLGMNRGALSFVTQTGTRRFAYCISDRDASGFLLIDESDLPYSVPLNYTPLIQIPLPLPYFDRVAYSVQLEGIKVAGTLLPIPKSVLVPDHTGAGQTMVDSGTQFTFLLGPAYDALKNEFLRQTRGMLAAVDDPNYVFQGAFDTCFKIRGDAGTLRLPEVVLVLRGAEVRVMRERLLYPAGGGTWCLTFGNSDLMGMEAYVIGHHHQVNVWVEYDLEKGRVGFGPVQCDVASQKLGLVL